MIFRTISDETSITGQKFVTSLQARKIAQQQATEQLTRDINCLRQYESACQSGNVTSETFNSTMANASVEAQTYAQSIKNGTGSAQAYENAQRQIQQSIQKTTMATKAANIGMKALSITMNMFAGMAIAGAINFVIKSIDKFITTIDETKEKTSELISNYENAIKTANSNADSINKISKRYEELAKGVNNLGENVSLTNDEYDEYNSMVNEIADMFPTLVRGYTDEGNAILALKGNVDQLTNAYKEAQQEAYNLLISTGKDANGNDIIKRWDDLQDTGFWAKTLDLGSDDINKGISVIDAVEQLKAIQNMTAEEYREIERIAGVYGSDALSKLSKLESDIVYSGYLHKALGLKWDITDEDFASAKKQASVLVQTYNAEIQEGLSNIESIANAYLMTNEDYERLDDSLKSAVSIIVNNLDADIASSFHSITDVGEYVQSIIDSITSNPNAKTALIELFSLDTQELTPDIVKESVDKYINILSDVLQTDANALKIRLGFEDIDELESRYEAYLSQFGDSNKNRLKNFFENNSINSKEELDTWATVTDGISLATDAMNKYLLSINDTKTSIDSLKESLAETYDGAYSDTLDNVSKIEEAMQSMAEGELLDFNSMWEIYNMDTYGLIGMVKQVGDEYSMSTVDVIRLKDKLLSLMREELELEKEKAVQNKINAESELRQIEKSLREAEGKFPTPNIMELKERQEELNKEIYDYSQLINKVNLSQEALNAHLGDTIDYTEKLQAQLDKYEEEVDKLQEQADAMLEAQTDKIDGIIEKHESEKEILENQKESLEEQLELLEEQQEELEEIIDNYETVADYIGNVIQKEIDTIEDSRQKIEDYYDSQIERIQNANESRQEAIDLEEKLAAYQNAQKNKVKIYKAGAGYVYATDKEAVTDARNEYLSAQRDKKVSDLEKEKESAMSGYDEQVKALESYANKWKEVSEGVVDAENSALAEQILGVEWRAKIKAQDTDILNKFSSNYLSYKSKLDSLVNGEMASLQKSIEAKEDEIKAKEAQIDSWENYKSEIERIATEIENTWNGYNDNLANIALNENSSYTDRLNNLQAFANSYGEITKEIEGYNKQITDTQAMLDEIDNNSKSNDIKLGVSSPSASPNSRLSSLYDNLSKTLIGIFERLILSLSGRNMGGTGTFMTRMFTGDINANGGVNSKTGFTWMDGTTSSSEVTFNAADAKKLYDFIHNTRSLSSVFAENFMKNLNKADNKLSATSKNPVNISIDAHIENVNANDVSDFADKWEGHMNKYMDKLYTESKVYSPVK